MPPDTPLSPPPSTAAPALAPHEVAALLAQAIRWHHGDAQDQHRAGAAYRRILQADPLQPHATVLAAALAAAQGCHDDAARWWGQAAQISPGDAQVHAAHARALLQLRDFEGGLRACERAIALGADSADVHNDHGAAYTGLRRFKQALPCYERALARDPAHAAAFRNRGRALLRLQRPDEALPIFHQVLAQSPGDAQVLVDIGAAMNVKGQPAVAREWLQRALAIEPDHVFGRYHLGQILLADGDWERGWPLFEVRRRTEIMEAAARPWPQPRWDGTEPLAGRTLMVYNDHGLGDGIMLCRFLPTLAAAGARVLLEVQPALFPLLRDFPGVSQLLAEGDDPPPFDLYCGMFSLPALLGLRVDTMAVPGAYLRADPQRARHWAQQLGPGRGRPRIGLAWSGNPAHGNDVRRSMPLATLLQGLPAGCHYVCLQAQVREADLAVLQAHPEIRHFLGELVDFGETAALAEQLDAVVSVDTSIAHLAGALGKPTAILLPWPAEFRWLRERADTPWYASARLYRQGPEQQWRPVFEQLAADLRSGRLLGAVAGSPHPRG